MRCFVFEGVRQAHGTLIASAGRRETVGSLTPPASLIIVFFVVVIFLMGMIAANETLASCIQLGANLSARVLVGMHVHIRVTRTDSTQQLRKFASGNSLTSRTNDVCCRDDSFQLSGRARARWNLLLRPIG